MTPADPDLDAAAKALIATAFTPRRRARPRLAEPLQEAEGRIVDTPSGPVMAWRLGSGPAVLLVHGWEDDNALWGPMIDRLLADGRAVVTLDLPGHGFSPAETVGLKAAGLAVKAVAETLGPVEAAVAHSFGCSILTAALDAGLKAERAVLISTSFPMKRTEWLRRQSERGAPLEVVTRAIALFNAEEAATGAIFDDEAAAARMTAKALIVHSLDDEQCPPANAGSLAETWPSAELMWVDGLGHRLLVQDGEVTQRVAAFIDGSR